MAEPPAPARAEPLHHTVEGSPQLHCVEWRPELPRTVLLLHGANQHARYWDRFAPLLPDYRVVALDTRGHGSSEWSEDGAYGIEDYVADLVRTVGFVRDGRDQQLALVGHSTGALVSMIYAARHPEQLWAAAFVDIDPRPPDRQRDRLRGAGERTPRRFDSPDEVRANIERLTPDLPPDVVAMLAETGYARRDDGQYEQRMDRRTLAEYPQFDNRPVLPSIDIPTLVVRGEQSSVSSGEAAQAAAEALPQGQLALLTGEHQLQVQAPDALASALVPFLREHAPPE